MCQSCSTELQVNVHELFDLAASVNIFMLRWIVWYSRDLDISYEKTIMKGTSLILTGIVAKGVISEKHTGVSSVSDLFLNQKTIQFTVVVC